jgi:hypothetical protein
MRSVRGRHECANCGARLEVADEDVVNVMFRASSGQPNVRVVIVERKEIHRCEVRGYSATPSESA